VRFDDHPAWDGIDYEMDRVYRLVTSSVADGFPALVALADTLPADRLCWLGVSVIEPLLDQHWEEVGEAFEQAAHTHSSLRKALSCASLNDHQLNDRLHGLVRSEEDIGRRSATDDPKPKWQRQSRPPLRDVRIAALSDLAGAAAAEDVPLQPNITRITALSDPGAAHLLWARYRCDRPISAAPFYRCGLMLHMSHQAAREAVVELDLLVADVDALPETPSWRVLALLTRHLERLPGLHEIGERPEVALPE
jgi:hypothetical protein